MLKRLNKRSALMGVGYGAVVLILSLLFMHVDLMETANHAYVLLDCIFGGRFLDFYNVVTEHANTLYYINGAHYSVLFYLIYALWELPIWLINTLFGLPVNEGVLWLWAKGPAVLSAAGCGLVVEDILNSLEQDGRGAKWALLLNPVFVFFAVCAGQYDSVGLIFALLAVRALLKDKELLFCLFMGVAVCCKFFALFIAVPVILLRNKKLWQIIKNLLLCMLPWVATTLLFMGRTGNSGNFTATIFLRLFERTFAGIPLFPLVYVLAVMVCWLAPRRAGAELLRDVATASIAVYGALLLFIDWHPQWAVLMVPFWVLAAAMGKNKTLYYYLCLAVSAGVMFYSWLHNPGQFELNLCFYGLLYPFGLADRLIWSSYSAVSSFAGRMQSAVPLLRSLVYFGVFAVLAARLPLFGGVSLADKHLRKKEEFSLPMLWLIFGGCFAVFAAVLLIQYLMM